MVTFTFSGLFCLCCDGCPCCSWCVLFAVLCVNSAAAFKIRKSHDEVKYSLDEDEEFDIDPSPLELISKRKFTAQH